MAKPLLVRVALSCLTLMAVSRPASAQIAESLGSRALGMGGAFVAVASDSTATWWNPGALAAGPFLDLSIGHAITEAGAGDPSRADRATWFTLGTPPFGLSYYRLKISNIQRLGATTGQGGANREDRGAGVPVRSLGASQLDVTLVHTLLTGVHAGTTLKYLR